MIRVPELIERKRDGGELSAEELAELMLGYAEGLIPDYQLAAFCMAVFFRGLTSAETYAMTDALIRTGETVDLHGALGRKVVDKHSTGGATANLVPADKKLYALRDVTATVDNYSLIAASIMSKKIAGGADAIVLDVKVGDGAFMKARADAERLADVMIDLGRRAGREVVAVISDMDEPLGHAVGNALEIREAMATLRGDGPPDFVQLVVEASTQLLALSDLGVSRDEARGRVDQAIADGSALAAYERWITAQGGNPDEAALPSAPVVREVVAPRAGHVRSLGAVQVGNAALHLGAGRRDKDDAIDHAVGVLCLKKHGDTIASGDTLAEIHARDESSAAAAADEVLAAYEVADEAPRERNVILDVIRA